MNSIRYLNVRAKPGGDPSVGILEYEGHHLACRLGKNGITVNKREGDGCTPEGTFRLLYGWHNKPRVRFPNSQLGFRPTEPNDGWCDDPASPAYNRPIALPFPHSHEKMMREDRLYDICIVLDQNIHPRKRGGGSAIFFHLTSPEPRGTEGCVAIDPQAMRRLLPFLSKNTRMRILL